MNRAEELFERIKKDGQKVIDELIQEQKSEELFLDFKRSADDGKGKFLHDHDKNNLAKAISGFGNSEGGLLIWGVDTKGESKQSEAASGVRLLVDSKKFVSLIENAISGLTIPPHAHVENIPVRVGKKGEGFVVTYITQGEGLPYQTIYNKLFYIRAGSNFEPIPYQVLASMFGKRPQPKVSVMFTMAPAKVESQSISVQIGFMIHNTGPGIARDIFINAKIMSAPGPNCSIAFETPDTNNWTGGFNFGRFMNLISKTDLKIPPDAEVQPLVLNATFSPPFEDDLKIDLSCGCEGSPTMRTTLHNDSKTIQEIYSHETTEKTKGNILTMTLAHELVKRLVKSEPKSS